MILALVILIGLILSLTGGIIVLVQAFKQHVAWGLCSLLIPFASLVFIIKFWQQKWVRNGFYLNLAGTVIILIVSLAGGTTG